MGAPAGAWGDGGDGKPAGAEEQRPQRRALRRRVEARRNAD
jgi:hypothetical protein